MSSLAPQPKEASGAEEDKPKLQRYGSIIDQREAERMEHLCLAVSESSPPWAAAYLQKAAPCFGVVAAGAEFVIPKAWQLCVGGYNLYQALPKRMAACMCGMGVCFFGGRYAVSLAAIEAFKSTGGSQMFVWLGDLRDECSKVLEANEKDEDRVDDKGMPIVDKMSTAALAKHKAALVLKTVDPQKLTSALNGLWTGYMGVLATLRFKFAKTVALAHSISDFLRPVAAKVFAPVLLHLTPPDYRKWVNPVIKCSCQYAALKIAWKIEMIISTVHSGMAGGHMVVDNLLAFAQEHQHLMWIGAGHLTTDIFATGLAGCGIYFQLVKGGAVPFPFWLLMMPLDVLERFLQWQVTYMMKEDAAK
mmetsp:Transcript_72767/g.137617  ORF Transcript_72767/g.137617 Transcript_72767/m.137617 type:complete len:361 (+) Transcript_72767:58-1140(+)